MFVYYAVAAISILVLGLGVRLAAAKPSSNKSRSPSPPLNTRDEISGRGWYRDPWFEREARRNDCRRVAMATLRAMIRGSYIHRSRNVSLEPYIQNSKDATTFYPEDSDIMENWKSNPPRGGTQSTVQASLSVLNIPTLSAARILFNSYRFRPGRKAEGSGRHPGTSAHHMFESSSGGPAPPKTGVLNFASATKPGGGFLNGAESQEGSIARVSTLFPSLDSREGRQFYNLHSFGENRTDFYTHSMIYSPGVIVFHNDAGDAVDPYAIEVISCAAVNAKEVLNGLTAAEISGAEVEIENVMEERMGRVLYLFETHGIRNIVLGTFGTGVFKNKVSVVARLWARLLVGRFRFSFDRVIFAITGDGTFVEFKGAFDAWVKQREVQRDQGSPRDTRTSSLSLY